MPLGTKRTAWVAAAFLLVSFVTRIGLAVFSGETFAPSAWVRFLAVGVVFDLAVLAWILLPWTLYDALLPRAVTAGRLRRLESVWAMLCAAAFLGFFLVTAAAEFAFWGRIQQPFRLHRRRLPGLHPRSARQYLGELSHRPVDDGNPDRLPGNCLADLAPRDRSAVRGTVRATLEPSRRNRRRRGSRRRCRRPEPRDLSSERLRRAAFGKRHVRLLFHAYRHNELDYERYYPVLSEQELEPEIRTLLAEPNSRFIEEKGIDRAVTSDHPQRDVNVVLISVESLSADYLGVFGNKQNLTPELDRLAGQGLLFTNLYATGTRTVRGLEALSVGTPPTPGQSIVRRPGNDGLENLGEELGEQGWSPYWIYGGYGFFDNMNAYFGANHYTVVDRAEMDTENLPIHHENIWGIADEDLYSLALTRLDREHDKGGRFFAHYHDHLEPPALYLPGKPRRPAAEASRGCGQVHRLGNRRLPAPRRRKTVVRQHPVRHPRRSHGESGGQDRPAALALPHPDDLVCAEGC